MVRVKNECCGCAVPAYPCRGEYCPLRRVRHYYCDRCGKEVDDAEDLRDDEDGVALCDACWEELFDTED